MFVDPVIGVAYVLREHRNPASFHELKTLWGDFPFVKQVFSLAVAGTNLGKVFCSAIVGRPTLFIALVVGCFG